LKLKEGGDPIFIAKRVGELLNHVENNIWSIAINHIADKPSVVMYSKHCERIAQNAQRVQDMPFSLPVRRL
jgi:hypothetical protein